MTLTKPTWHLARLAIYPSKAPVWDESYGSSLVTASTRRLFKNRTLIDRGNLFVAYEEFTHTHHGTYIQFWFYYKKEE